MDCCHVICHLHCDRRFCANYSILFLGWHDCGSHFFCHQFGSALCCRRVKVADHHPLLVGVRFGDDLDWHHCCCGYLRARTRLRCLRLDNTVVARILLADDQRDVLEALRILLKGEGYQTEAVTSHAGIFSALEKKDYALLIMDLNYARDTTSGQEGLAAIAKIQEIDNTLPIVVMKAWATIDLAVEAMKRGARDFVPKPWDNERLLTILRTQIELATALRRGRKLEAENQMLRGSMPNVIAESPPMQPVIEMISRVAPSDANVLITGENGTGKGLIAQALNALSPRASRTMITVNMGGLSEEHTSELQSHHDL